MAESIVSLDHLMYLQDYQACRYQDRSINETSKMYGNMFKFVESIKASF